MSANDFTQLLVQAPQVTIHSAAKDCLQDGFNFPTFRLLNKQERVKLSSNPLRTESNIKYNLFAVANSKGWFVAATVQSDASYALSCSTLADLRSESRSATSSDELFTTKRTVTLHSRKPNLLSLACNDTRLLVSFESGELAVYDTASLFCEGSNPVAPIHSLSPEFGQIRCIVPNPGAEPHLVDFIAIVFSNKTVVLYNSKLEVHGGWISSTMNVNEVPVDVTWSPKGKHLAIGLQGGDILTYPLTNKSSVHKHIPSTCQSPLIGLNWLSPGHTFRTAYAASSSNDTLHHIICLDTKASTATYYAPGYPFPLPDRMNQPFTAILPRWDEDAGSSEPKSLMVVGDRASVDLEVLGNAGGQWYQQSQENPISLPLDSNMDDTFLLALDTDLTDAENSVPIMYIYLNDGTIQAWHMESSKPYPNMITSQASANPIPSSASPQPAASAIAATPTPASPTQHLAFGQPAFGQNNTPSAFGQPSAFGKPSAFGQPQSTPVFGTSGFGQVASGGGTSPFGQASSSTFGGTVSSPFGQPQSSPAFGQPAATSAFGAADTSSTFGKPSLGVEGTATAFGSVTTTTNAFGGISTTGAFGGGVFGSSTNNNAFGGGTFGSITNKPSTQSSFGQPGFGFGGAASPEISREASMSDSTPSFGSLDLGQSNDSDRPEKAGGIFGSLPPVNPSTATSAFGGGLVKPATGFGALNNHPAAQASPSSSTSNTSDESKPLSGLGATSTFGSTNQPSFGRSSFGSQPASGQTTFGQSAFGQPSFGQSSFSKPASATGAGGFSGFASGPSSLSAAAQQAGSTFGSSPASSSKPTSDSGGFSAFASSSASPFGSTAASQAHSGSPAPANSGFGNFTSSAFGNNTSQGTTPTSPQQGGSQKPLSAFASSGDAGPSGFRTPIGPEKESSLPIAKTPSKPAGLIASPPSSPESTPRLGKASIVAGNDSPPGPSRSKLSGTPTSSPFGNAVVPSSGAFGNLQTSPSVFKPATGFGAFGSDKIPDSPFFKVSADSKTPPQTAFTAGLATSPTKTPTTMGNSVFGSSSALGIRSAFAPVTTPAPPAKTPAAGGFTAFSGATSAFGLVDGPKKSFGELLKIGDVDTADPVKPSGGPVQSEEGTPKPTSASPSPSQSASDVSQREEAETRQEEDRNTDLPSAVLRAKEPEGNKSREKLPEELSFGNISLLSDTSSFAEVEHEETDDDGIQSGTEDADEDSAAGHDTEEDSLSSEENEDDEETGSPSVSDESSRLSDVPEEDEEEEEEEDLSPLPTSVPLPLSRSPSATPQPEVPKVQVTPSPSPQPAASRESTTPPGTPSREPAIPSRSASVPVSTAPPSTPFGLGLGRPSTRPTRSSPLASVPISLADESELPPTSAKLPLSPQPRLAALPSPTEIPMKGESAEEAKSSVLTKPPRPKTPPLLSAFGTKKVDVFPTASITSPTIETGPAHHLSTPTTDRESWSGNKPEKSEASPDISPGSHSLAAQSTALFGNKPSPGDIEPAQPAAKTSLPAPSTSSPSDSSLKSKDTSSETTPGRGLSSTAINSATLANVGGGLSAKGPPSVPVGSSFSLGGQLQLGVRSGPSSEANAAPTSSNASTPFGLSAFSFKGKSPVSETLVTPPPPFDLSGSSLKGKGVTTFNPSASQLGSPAPSGGIASQIPVEAGMQRECVLVVNAMNDDLANLGAVAAKHKEQLQVIRARTGGRQRQDLLDAKKWSPVSAVLFGQVLVQFEKDLDELKDIRDEQRQKLKQIQNNMLKAGTRKEEISRFNKAKNDKEFAKMLRMRTLGPEHLETQMQLRRSIKTIRDRIEKLEEHLKASKKKLSQAKTGRPVFRAPSLDTINRTFRNIDLAIAHQSTDIRTLKERIAKLGSIYKSSTPLRSPLHRDERLPDRSSRLGSYNVTPHVAVTTAAALNAERAAHRLKRALFEVRKEPLLNKTAVTAPPAPLSFQTPQKLQPSFSANPSHISPGGEFKIPAGTSLFSLATPQQAQIMSTPLPDWSPLSQDGSTYSPSPGRRGATAGKKHNIIPLPKKPSGASPTPAPTFNWGPLPKFDYGGNKGKSAMVEAVRVVPITKK